MGRELLNKFCSARGVKLEAENFAFGVRRVCAFFRRWLVVSRVAIEDSSSGGVREGAATRTGFDESCAGSYTQAV